MGKVATREAYGAALAQYGADERIIVLDADLSKSTKTSTFKQVYPERHFNMGIAEANMMCVAAGLVQRQVKSYLPAHLRFLRQNGRVNKSGILSAIRNST